MNEKVIYKNNFKKKGKSMGWYEAIKDGINAAQKADNIPLVNNLIEVQKQILDLIDDNNKLKNENAELKAKKDLIDKIERHKDACITLKGDSQRLIYCSNCFDSNQKLIQAQTDEDGTYWCPSCKYRGYYDMEIYNSKYNVDLDTKDFI